MIKQKKMYIYSAIIISLLLIVLFVVLMTAGSKWKKGIYPIKNDIVIYSEDSSVNMQIGLIVVGKDVYKELYNNEMDIDLIGEEDTLKTHYQVISTVEEKKYYFIEMLLSCDLSKDSYNFTDIKIKDSRENNMYKPIGNINVNVLDTAVKNVMEGVEGDSTALGMDDSYLFLYGISNTSSNDIEILDVIGEFKDHKDTSLTVLSLTNPDNAAINLLDGKRFSYPVILPRQKKVYFIYSVKKADEDSKFINLNINPYIQYKNIGEDNIRLLCLRDSGNTPFSEITADEVYSFISTFE